MKKTRIDWLMVGIWIGSITSILGNDFLYLAVSIMVGMVFNLIDYKVTKKLKDEK